MDDPRKMERADWILLCRNCGGWVQLATHDYQYRDLLNGPETEGAHAFENNFHTLESALEFYAHIHLFNYDLMVGDFARPEQRPEMCECGDQGVTEAEIDAFKKWRKLLEQYSDAYDGNVVEIEVEKEVPAELPKECRGCSIIKHCEECRECGFFRHEEGEIHVD